MGRYVKNPEINQTAQALHIPSGTTAEQPQDPEQGQLRYNSSVTALEFFNGTNFVQLQGAVGAKATITRDSFTLDGSTTVFGPMSFDPEADANILVFIEGVFQKDDTYSTSGTTITLTSTLPSDAGKTLTILHGFDAL